MVVNAMTVPREIFVLRSVFLRVIFNAGSVFFRMPAQNVRIKA